jgi:hypothetical protein
MSSAETMLRDLHEVYEPLRGGFNGVPNPLRLHRIKDHYVLVITRQRWENGEYFSGATAREAIEKAWSSVYPLVVAAGRGDD